MYWQEQGDSEAVFKQDIMDYFEKYSRQKKGCIVASAHSNFTDGDGDNPPHKKARSRYEKIVSAGRFICTHEYPSKEKPVPLVFTIGAGGIEFDDQRQKRPVAAALASAVVAARGGGSPPSLQVGFGSGS
jgi:hypothetical protein